MGLSGRHNGKQGIKDRLFLQRPAPADQGKDEDKVLALRAAAANPAMSDADFATMARGLAIPDKPDTGPRVHKGVRSSHLKADYDPAMPGGVDAMTRGLYNAPAGSEGLANAIVDAADETP